MLFRSDEPITIAVCCRVTGDDLWVDFTGSSPASRRGINVVMNYTEAYTTYGVKDIVSPDLPNNEGAFRVLRITAPEGSILNVRPPAPVAVATPDGTARSCPPTLPCRNIIRDDVRRAKKNPAFLRGWRWWA